MLTARQTIATKVVVDSAATTQAEDAAANANTAAAFANGVSSNALVDANRAERYRDEAYRFAQQTAGTVKFADGSDSGRKSAFAYAGDAEKWAEEDEDVEIKAGQFSAKHHRIKAELAEATAQNHVTATGANAASALAAEKNASTFAQMLSIAAAGISGTVATAADLPSATGSRGVYYVRDEAAYYSDATGSWVKESGSVLMTIGADGDVILPAFGSAPPTRLRNLDAGPQIWGLVARHDGPGNYTGQVAVVPTGTGGLAGATAHALFRVLMNDIMADPTNFESADFESHAPTDFGDGAKAYYAIKTRQGGTGKHRPFLFQIGGRNGMWLQTNGDVEMGARPAGEAYAGNVVVYNTIESTNVVAMEVRLRHIKTANTWGLVSKKAVDDGTNVRLIYLWSDDVVDVGDGRANTHAQLRLNAAGGAVATVSGTGINLGSGKTLSVGGTQVLTSRRTGWGNPTGSATRTTFATSTVTLVELAERVKALIDDLKTHGLIGA